MLQTASAMSTSCLDQNIHTECSGNGMCVEGSCLCKLGWASTGDFLFEPSAGFECSVSLVAVRVLWIVALGLAVALVFMLLHLAISNFKAARASGQVDFRQPFVSVPMFYFWTITLFTPVAALKVMDPSAHMIGERSAITIICMSGVCFLYLTKIMFLQSFVRLLNKYLHSFHGETVVGHFAGITYLTKCVRGFYVLLALVVAIPSVEVLFGIRLIPHVERVFFGELSIFSLILTYCTYLSCFGSAIRLLNEARKANPGSVDFDKMSNMLRLMSTLRPVLIGQGIACGLGGGMLCWWDGMLHYASYVIPVLWILGILQMICLLQTNTIKFNTRPRSLDPESLTWTWRLNKLTRQAGSNKGRVLPVALKGLEAGSARLVSSPREKPSPRILMPSFKQPDTPKSNFSQFQVFLNSSINAEQGSTFSSTALMRPQLEAQPEELSETISFNLNSFNNAGAVSSLNVPTSNV